MAKSNGTSQWIFDCLESGGICASLFSFLCFVVFTVFLAFLTRKKKDYTVQFNGVSIVTTVTNSALIIGSVLDEFRSKRLIGLDIEWNSSSHTNKVATLQLCHGTRCLIIQLHHLNAAIPTSLRNLLSDRSITFVGVGITEDITKLDCDYGLKCWSGCELGSLADSIYGTNNRFYGAGLATLMHQIVGLRIEKSEKVTRSDWSANVLSVEQIKYATIDAYASFAIGTTLLYGYK